MATQVSEVLTRIAEQERDALVSEWEQEVTRAGLRRGDLMNDDEVRRQTSELLRLFAAGFTGGTGDTSTPAWSSLREALTSISRSRARQGFTPRETALFLFSLKRPFVTRLRDHFRNKAEELSEATWFINSIIDELGLFTTEVVLKAREEMISRQQQEMLELSTPVVQLWDNILALPMIGTLDSARTQVVMESLLQRIVDTGSSIAILDITGVPTVDTLVAQHLLKTVAAARLMGAECIISGIRPQIAQTIVHLGVDLSDVLTKATLADAFRVALDKTGATGDIRR